MSVVLFACFVLCKTGAEWAPYVSTVLLQQIHSCNKSVVTNVHTPTGADYTVTRRARPVQIVDIAPLLDEIELLEIRLYELRDLVDWFIVIEQNETFTGLPKELLYHKHVGRLTNLLGQHVMRKVLYYNCPYPADYKIEKVVLGSSPQQAQHWRREHFMRNTCARTMVEEMRYKQLQPSALLLMSDMDEIPDAFAVASFKYCRYEQPAAADSAEARLIFFGQVRYHFNFHCASSNMYHWTGTMLTTVEHALAIGLQTLRDKRQQAPVGADLRVPHGFGGWHFSNSPFGDVRKLVNKYRSFSESQTMDHVRESDAYDYWSHVMLHGGDVRSNTHCHGLELRHLPRLVHDLPHKYIGLLSKNQIDRLID